MKTNQLIIATASILLIGWFLTGCQVVEPKSDQKTSKTVIEKFVMKAVAAKKEVKLVLKADHQANQVNVTLTLENPNLKPITSAQTWLSYNPLALKGASINTKDSAFDLMAPYDNTFDENNGLVMVGRGSTKPLTGKSIKVAELTFDVLGGGATMIDAYDYQENLSGHTSVNTVVNGEPFNILLKPNSPALIIE